MSSEANSSQRVIILASRASKLARIQTESTLAVFETTFPSNKFEASFVSSEAGDKDKVQALYILGGKSLWTKELEVALKDKTVDMLVHCLKDMPTILPDGCEIAAVLERASPLDSLVVKYGKGWKTLEELPEGSVVGTGSIRRVAQLKRRYPLLHFKDVRGNLDTRLSKLDDPQGPYSALILAKAGLVRMKLEHRIACDLAAPELYYAVGQGALAIEIRSDDEEARELCRKVNHWPTHWMTAAERAMLKLLEGGCSVPVGVSGQLDIDGEQSGKLTLSGSVTAVGGSRHVEHTIKENIKSLKDAEQAGIKLARKLVEIGAREILDEVNEDRAKRIGESKSSEERQKLESLIQTSTTT